MLYIKGMKTCGNDLSNEQPAICSVSLMFYNKLITVGFSSNKHQQQKRRKKVKIFTSMGFKDFVK